MGFITPKQRARIRIVQALYQWQLTKTDVAIIEKQFLANKKDKIAKTFFQTNLNNIISNIGKIREYIKPLLKHNIDDIPLVDLAVLYLGVYELKISQVTPSKIIINEAINISKDYGSEDSYKFVNYILDSLK